MPTSDIVSLSRSLAHSLTLSLFLTDLPSSDVAFIIRNVKEVLDECLQDGAACCGEQGSEAEREVE